MPKETGSGKREEEKRRRTKREGGREVERERERKRKREREREREREKKQSKRQKATVVLARFASEALRARAPAGELVALTRAPVATASARCARTQSQGNE